MKLTWKNKALPPAMVFILMLGVVSLLSDMTHEGAASIRGAYLALLGASAATIGFISGLGELIGYSLRLLFGQLTDRTKQYWPITIIGYCVDVLAIPALALVGDNGWIMACGLLVAERLGKAIRKPAKDTILSFAATQQGAGKSFAIQEALDQIGAFLGPVILYIIMLFKTDGSTREIYSVCFAVLGIPAILTIIMLFWSKKKFPNPETFEPEPKEIKPFRLNAPFLLYLAGIGVFAFGFIDFALIAMHVVKKQTVSSDVLPLLYAGAMLIDAAAALFFGWLYDRRGMWSLIISTLVSAWFALFIFGGDTPGMTVLGVLLWGIGMGAQESILKAVVAGLVPKANRAAGYGIFECAFGVFWFLGSWLVGILYDRSIPLMIAVSVIAQLLAIPLFYLSARRKNI
ncbi:MAG: MFS transporter [Victivallaceae bacterium]|nr:MFS transporter [Victivallaceae bacterium]